MMPKIPTLVRFLGLFGWLGIVGVAGAIFLMEVQQPVSRDVVTKMVWNQESMVFVNGKATNWTSMPVVQLVTRNKGTVLRVRSDLYEIVEGHPLTVKTISF
ncbi:MAG: hypothetical protein AB7P17_08505 [Nitrospirales bacterium]|nr:hypothetical protein [Nitrospirales bacterium]